MNAIQQAFDRAKSESRAALIAYLPAGFPDADTGLELALAVAEGGADLIEVGWPYSDPLMDGPVIQAAVEQALAAGTKFHDVLTTVSAIAQTKATPLVMTYWNPVERVGVREFADRLSSAGGAGVITPDLTPEEAGEWYAASTAAGLGRVFLVAPSSSDARIEKVVAATTGFVYAASLMGVTGTRTQLSGSAAGLVERTRQFTELPIAVGLGVSTPAQAAEVAKFADGVIVGSAFVKAAQEAGDRKRAVSAVRELAERIVEGLNK